jgi:integrase/recombinase XerD
LLFYNSKPIEEITNEDIIIYNNDFILKNKLSASYQNQIVNAVKLFFRTIENKVMNEELLHRPRTEKKLPNVLSKEEVKAILNALSNLKHKTMLSLIYSCGLRSGELINLKLEHVDSKRQLLIIKRYLRYIQEILGHSSSKTKKFIHMYLSIQKITSPFDSL